MRTQEYARPWPYDDDEPPKANGRWTGDKEPRIRLIPFDEITIDDAGEEWLIKHIAPRVGIGVTWGPSQTYKSFLELDQDMHIALGWEYRGHRVHQGAVVYCAFEGGRGVTKRVEAWRRHHLPDHSEPVPFYLQPVRLELVKEADELIKAIREQLGGVAPVKISLDTLNRSITGSESNDGDMRAYLEAADKLREGFDCYVNIIHHPGWDTSRLRGHTSLPCAVEVETAVTRAGDYLATLEIKKMKDGETGLTLHNKLEKVHLGFDADGDPITSLVAVEAEAPAKTRAPARSKTRAPTNAAVIAERAVREAIARLGTIPPASNYIPSNVKAVTEAQWRKYAYERGISTGGDRAKEKAFARGVERLVADGIVGTWQGFYWLIKE